MKNTGKDVVNQDGKFVMLQNMVTVGKECILKEILKVIMDNQWIISKRDI